MTTDRRGSVLSGQTVITYGSGTSQILQDEKKAKTFIILSRGPLLFVMFAISAAIFITCGIIRSVIVLEASYKSYAQFHSAEVKLSTFRAMEDLAAIVYRECFARMKYISSGLNPIYYNEMATAVNDMDLLFSAAANDFRQVYFTAPEYRQYNCSFYSIRSNLGSRASAIPINQHRSLDERSINAWDDVDFYDCLLVQLADIQLQAMATAKGLDDVWQSTLTYISSLRAVLNFQIGVNFAFLTRELILNKGSVTFKRASDADQMDNSAASALYLMWTADHFGRIGTAPSAGSARQIIEALMVELDSVKNATKAYLLVVNGEKFDMTTRAKQGLALTTAAKEEFKADMLKRYGAGIENSLQSIISEAVKLFFFAILLPLLTIRVVMHFFKEAARLKGRYEVSVERYIDSCKAIFRLLPEPVAKKLNVGLQVRPEFYHSTTVFYSDIVGFTTICSKLTAIQVLQMLNTIYTTFDHRVKIHSCYKIETIGDAYVVASGVPVRSTTHAVEIASLALVLLEEVGMIKVPNSTRKVTVRIGINSGPVIAGIVGVKMLRYCLFGKTVLYAARMEQTSQAQRIHLSTTAHDELVKQGGFITEQRPKNEWPAGSQQPTHWLIGKTTVAPTLSLFSTVDNNTAVTHVDISA